MSYSPTQPAVYVLWGDDHRPLYVGMSTCWGSRVYQHRKKEWFDQIEMVDVYFEPDVKAMRALELRLIRELEPIHNVHDGGTALHEVKPGDPLAQIDPNCYYGPVAIKQVTGLDVEDTMLGSDVLALL